MFSGDWNVGASYQLLTKRLRRTVFICNVEDDSWPLLTFFDLACVAKFSFSVRVLCGFHFLSMQILG